MNVDDALHAVVHDYPGGSESLAPRLGMSAAVLRNKVNTHCDTHHASVRDLRRIVAMTGDMRPLHALAAEFNHVLIQPPEGEDSSDMAILEAFSALWEANGTLGTTVHQALADGTLTQSEMARIRAGAYALQARVAGLLDRLGGMAEPEASR